MTKVLYVPKRTDSMAFMLNNAIACAMRTYCKILGYKYHENNKAMWCKTPDKQGDSTKVELFYREYPSVITNNEDMYDENEAKDYYINVIGGSKLGIGYAFITDLCDMNYCEYNLIDVD